MDDIIIRLIQHTLGSSQEECNTFRRHVLAHMSSIEKKRFAAILHRYGTKNAKNLKSLASSLKSVRNVLREHKEKRDTKNMSIDL